MSVREFVLCEHTWTLKVLNYAFRRHVGSRPSWVSSTDGCVIARRVCDLPCARPIILILLGFIIIEANIIIYAGTGD